jgi:uncharacterized protein YdeI (YjbR/CyaY-like superfamily)
VLSFAGRDDWAAWLDANHATAPGVWLAIARKGAGVESVSRAEALDEALCYGWIDGQARRQDDFTWLQKFTPRAARSIWSKVNCAKVEALIAAGRMRPAGLHAVERARQDGRWDAAYEPPSRAVVPPDLQAALDADAPAAAFFATLDRTNRYAVLFRIATAKRPETRERRIRQFVDMLARGEKLRP